ncbi:hypothetical protein QBC45DRAFT_340274, partial [Copromyces sp. CBS 386.78]
NEAKSYPKKIGSLNWLSAGIRLNISFTVSKLSKANINLINCYIAVIKYL